ncbi:unnamed protein product, partial [Rotaria magnacalcarata]
NSSELASKTTEFTIDTKHHYYTTTINSVIGSDRTFTASVRDAILVDKIAFNEISSIVSPSNSPSRRHPKENVEHDTVAEDLQEKYQALLRRFEQTVHISSDALNLSRISEYAPSTMTSDLRLLLNDLTNYNNGKKQENYHKDTRTVKRHAIQHHEIDRSTLRINRHQSRLRRSHSASSKTREGSLQKGFLCASTNALNVRPLVHKHDFNDPTITIDNEITTNVKTTTKHHLLLGNENDLVQVLNEQFPGIYVSTEMQAKLYDQFSKHIDSVFKSRVELLNSQQGNINDVRIENENFRFFF